MKRRRNHVFRLEMLLLCILKQKDFYGYELVKAVKDQSLGMIDIKEGTMYPILVNLMDAHYITSRDEVANHKIRVYYHIEEEGIKYLETLIEEYYNMLEGINNILENSK